MTKEEFLSLIRTPDEVTHQRTEAIASLVKEFPYCQALRYFYLLQLHGQNHISYAQQLKLSSAYAPDRKRLHQLIHPELMMHDSVAWNENIALENEGMIDTSSEKKEVSHLESKDISVDEPIETYQDHQEETIDVTPDDSPAHPSAKEIEVENKEIQSDEYELSAEEIVIQRLKELNIWIEPEVDLLASSASASEENILVPHGMIEENVDSDLEAEIEELESFSAKQEEKVIAETKSATTKEKELDPIEELILENIVTSQVNSSDYFSEEKQDVITSDEPEDENLSEGNLEDNPTLAKAIATPTDPIPHQPGEVHSFAEWLHLNQKSDSKKEEKVEKKELIVQSETPFPAAQPSPKIVEQRPIVSEKETTTIPTAELKNSIEEIKNEELGEKTITDPAVSSPKMLYVKSTSSQPPTTPAEKIPFSTISNTPLDTDPNLIPPKKPIPDPSLVDTDPPKSKVPADQLIDKFIKQEPRITPSKSAFYSPINMARRSIIESDDIVSETLANIYAQQGNFQKAISFYTKLSLRFPEKSRYFAALIKELENKLNT
jgi:hypothetical protein